MKRLRSSQTRNTNQQVDSRHIWGKIRKNDWESQNSNYPPMNISRETAWSFARDIYMDSSFVITDQSLYRYFPQTPRISWSYYLLVPTVSQGQTTTQKVDLNFPAALCAESTAKGDMLIESVGLKHGISREFSGRCVLLILRNHQNFHFESPFLCSSP